MCTASNFKFNLLCRADSIVALCTTSKLIVIVNYLLLHIHVELMQSLSSIATILLIFFSF